MEQHKTMSDGELLSIVSDAERSAIIYQSEFAGTNKRLLEDYLALPYGNENSGKSQVISTDVADVVDSDMASLSRTFLGATQPVAFVSNTDNEQELEEVDEKNKYVNHLIMDQPESYATMSAWFKDACIQQNGVVKYYMDQTTKTEEHSYEGLTGNEVQLIMDDLGQDADSVDIVGYETTDEDDDSVETSFDIVFRTTRSKQKLMIVNVPTEQFLLSKNATTLDDAELVGDKSTKSRGQLIAEGFDEDVVNLLPTISTTSEGENRQATIRNEDTGQHTGSAIKQKSSDLVEVHDLYVLIDYDGDGIPERRHIMKCGNQILVNEPYNLVPYASLSQILMPHKVIGKSRAQLTQQTQRVKTAIQRQMLDNIYMVNNPRSVIHSDVKLEDMMNVQPNGLIRMKNDSQITPQAAVQPLVTPFIGDKALMMVQYIDSAQAQSTGAMMANQGLNADSISKETATRFNGIQEDSKAKIELVARNFAETGIKRLYAGVAWLVSHFQDSEHEMTILGKPLTVNPTRWRYENSVVAKVGLGAGKNDDSNNLQAIYQLQEKIKGSGSTLVDEVKTFNIIEDTLQALGIREVERYFNNPQVDSQLVVVENNMLKQQQAVLQEQLAQQQAMLESKNQLAEAEQVKAQTQQVDIAADYRVSQEKLAQDRYEFDQQMAFDTQKLAQEYALKQQELELKYVKDLDRSGLIGDNELG